MCFVATTILSAASHRIWSRSSEPPLMQRLRPRRRPTPPSSSCTYSLPSSPLTPTSPAGSTASGGALSSSINYSSLRLLIRCQIGPPTCSLHHSSPEGGGGEWDREEDCRGSGFSPRIGLLGQAKQGRYRMRATIFGLRIGSVCLHSCTPPHHCTQKHTPPLSAIRPP